MSLSNLLFASLLTIAALPAAAQIASPYTGQETREIKALSPEQINGLLAGKGMGYAKAAELNHYPGPAHVLELASQLQLTDAQLQATRDIHARMEAQAKALGARLVDAEAALERLFRSGTANENSTAAILDVIGKLQAELRGVHLNAHIRQREILSAEQIRRYMHLRGYHKAHHGAHGHGH